MAIAPQPQHLDEDFDDESYTPKPGHTLPGYTVDALLEQGKVEEAREELERLCLEGVDSGEPVLMTPERWEEFRLELHRKAKLAS
jgi:hypothetical protein